MLLHSVLAEVRRSYATGCNKARLTEYSGESQLKEFSKKQVGTSH